MYPADDFERDPWRTLTIVAESERKYLVFELDSRHNTHYTLVRGGFPWTRLPLECPTRHLMVLQASACELLKLLYDTLSVKD